MVFLSVQIDGNTKASMSDFIKYMRSYIVKHFNQENNAILMDEPYGAGFRQEFMFNKKPYLQIGGAIPERCVAIRKLTHITQEQRDDLEKYVDIFLKAHIKPRCLESGETIENFKYWGSGMELIMLGMMGGGLCVQGEYDEDNNLKPNQKKFVRHNGWIHEEGSEEYKKWGAEKN